MTLPLWLRLVRRRLFGPVPAAVRRRNARKAVRVRPRLEALEERLAPAASFQTLWNFTGGSDGQAPLGDVIADSSGNLYGTTLTNNNAGNVFRYNASTQTVTDLRDFAPPDGNDPQEGVFRDSSGNLFGTTYYGGNGVVSGGFPGDGTLFEMGSDGSNFTTLYKFSGSDGANPLSSLITDGKGNLYGTASFGGAFGDGTVYELSPNGSGGYNLNTLFNFDGTNGAIPTASLLLDGQGNLYGVTYLGGGPSNDGTVYQLSPNGSGGYNFQSLHSFTGSDGLRPSSNLLMDGKGNLYGTTQGLVSSSDGTVYELSPNGSGGYNFSTIHTFSGSDGVEPTGNWLIDGSGNLYGATDLGGGPANSGTVYELSPNGSGGFNLQTLHSFTVKDGAQVLGGVTTDGKGNLYGTTIAGGKNNRGTIFELSGVINVEPTTTTAASSQSTPFSTHTQNVTLTADVTSPIGTVNEGTVTFTLMQGSNVIGQATTSNTVNGGAASVSYALPANLAAGTYTIDAVYNPGPDFLGSFDDSHTLTVTPAQATTSTGGLTTFYSPNQQTLALSASVKDQSFSGDAVDEGSVTFTVMNGNTAVASVSGTVGSGTANANITLPAGLAPGSYTLAVRYTDSQGNFIDSGDSNGTLTIGAAKVATTAQNVPTFYSLSSQSVTLNASVQDESISSDTVNEGTVTFTVMNGNTKIGSVPGNVKNGAASANITLPAGLAAGNYTIDVGYSDSTGNFSDSGDTSGTLAIAAANVTASANKVSTVYSVSSQTVTLNASVADTSFLSDTVDEGTVTFNIMDGSTKIGSVSGNVTKGAASANFTLAAGQAAGNYTIDVRYLDGAGNFSDNGDNSAPLIIASAAATATAGDASAVFRPGAQNVTLTAGVTSNAGPVNEGTVTFTVMQGSTVIGSATTSNTVSNGAAGVSYALPANLAAGTYTIDAVYNPGPDFLGSSDDTRTLTVSPARVTTSAGSVTAYYSSNQQTVTLNATLADDSFSGDTVDEGTVTFTVLNGLVSLGSVAGTVSGGAASANFTLPAGQAVGRYTIAVSYGDNPSNFTDSNDNSNTLTVSPANVTVTAVTPPTVVYSSNAQNMTLSATVANTSLSSDVVNEGSVLFTIMNGNSAIRSVAGTVTDGTANANFTLPPGQAAGNYTIAVQYIDSPSNFVDSGDEGATLTVSPANVAVTANKATTAYSPNPQPLLLSATVTDTSDSGQSVFEGAVTFTVMDGSTVIGSSTGLVSNGNVNGAFTLPAGQAVGSYTIDVRYNDTQGNFGNSSDNSATLTVSPVRVSTATANVTAFYSPNSQTLKLRATVANLSDSNQPVGEGIVTFTVQDQNGKPVGSATGSVSGGTASADFTLPAGLGLGNYTLAVGYLDGSGNFSDSGDQSATLSVLPADVSTTANAVPAVYSTNTQTLALSATLADDSVPTDTVDTGTVTFTVQSGGTTLGSASGSVSSGTANATFTLPAGLAAGSYTIAVSYSDQPGNFTDSGDTSAALTVSPAPVTTIPSIVSTLYSPNKQIVGLSAGVTDAGVPGDTVNEGAVTFTIQNGGTSIGSVSGAVVGGTAHADLTLPAGLAPGSYTLAVKYIDGLGNFSDGGDSSSTLSVASANVATTAAATTVAFSPSGQTVTLNANVANTSVPSATVNEGAVTFTVMNGSTILGTAPGTVSGGKASADLTLPAGLAAGSYTLAVHYSDSQGNFSDGRDSNATLTVGAAGTTAQLTQITLAPALLSMTTTETLTAHVRSSTPVSQGSVTFFVSGHTVTANVDGNGNASAVVTMPMLSLLGPQDISVRYNDAANNLTASTDAETAAWRVFNPIVPSTATFAPNSDSVTADLFGLFITYTNGLLTEIDFGSLHLVFSYNAAGQLSQVTFDGMNLL